MSDMIATTAGRKAIAFIGATPWHGFGQRLTADASVETWVKEAGLGYTVAKSPPVEANVALEGEKENFQAIKNQVALFRTDTRRILGVVSNSHHKIVQPREMIEFFTDLIKDSGYTLDVAGAIRGGARVWGLANVPEAEMRIGGIDIVRPYLLLSTVYDGMRASRAQFTAVRVVCNNTDQMAYAEYEADKEAKLKSYVTVPHNREFVRKDIQAELGLVVAAAKQYAEHAEAMAVTKCSEADAVKFIIDLFAKYDKKTGEVTAASGAVCAGVLDSVKNSPGSNLKTANGTVWGLLNGVTHFLDFKARARSDENRLNSTWFGDSALLKQKAQKRALVMAA